MTKPNDPIGEAIANARKKLLLADEALNITSTLYLPC